MTDEKKSQDTQKYKLILVGKDLALIENFCRKLTTSTRDAKIEMSGVSRLPVKSLQITTRKSPCGNGSNTWDRFELRLYKRSFTIAASQDDLSELFKTCKNPASV